MGVATEQKINKYFLILRYGVLNLERNFLDSYVVLYFWHTLETNSVHYKNSERSIKVSSTGELVLNILYFSYASRKNIY